MPNFAVFKPSLKKGSSKARLWARAARATPRMRDILASGTGPSPKPKPKVKPLDYYATPEKTIQKRKNIDIPARDATRKRKIPVPSIISERTAVPVPGASASRKLVGQPATSPQEPARALSIQPSPVAQAPRKATKLGIVDRADREAVEQVFGQTSQGSEAAQPAPARLANIVTADEKLAATGKRDRNIAQLAQSVRSGKLNEAASVPPRKVSSMLEKALGGKINAKRAVRSPLSERVTNIHNQFVGAVARPSRKAVNPITAATSGTPASPPIRDSKKTESRLMGMLRNNDTAHVAKFSAKKSERPTGRSVVPLSQKLEKTLNKFYGSTDASSPRPTAPSSTPEKQRGWAASARQNDRTLSPTAGAEVGGTAAFSRGQASAIEVSAKAPVAKFSSVTPEGGGISKVLSSSSKDSSGVKTLKGSVQMTGPNGQSIGNLDFNSVEMM